MKKLSSTELEKLTGGIVCILPNENASSLSCFSNLCGFVNSLVESSGAPIVPFICTR